MAASETVIVISARELLRRGPETFASFLLADKVVCALPMAGEELLIPHFEKSYPHLFSLMAQVVPWLHEFAMAGVFCQRINNSSPWDFVPPLLNFAIQSDVLRPSLAEHLDGMTETHVQLMNEFAKCIIGEDRLAIPEWTLNAASLGWAEAHGAVLVNKVHSRTAQDIEQALIPKEAFSYAMPILYGAKPAALLEARSVLSDELHPLRIRLRRVSSLVSASASARDIRVTVEKEFLPQLEEYRKLFSARRSRLLDLVEGSERDIAAAAVTFAGLAFSGTATAASAITGAIAAAGSMSLRVFSKASTQKRLQAGTVFGFLARLERNRPAN